jgi:hypothetical protein
LVDVEEIRKMDGLERGDEGCLLLVGNQVGGAHGNRIPPLDVNRKVAASGFDVFDLCYGASLRDFVRKRLFELPLLVRAAVLKAAVPIGAEDVIRVLDDIADGERCGLS